MPVSIPCNSDDEGNGKNSNGIIAVYEHSNRNTFHDMHMVPAVCQSVDWPTKQWALITNLH